MDDVLGLLVGFVDHSGGAHDAAAGKLGAVVYYWAPLEYGRELAVVRLVLGNDNMRVTLLGEGYPGKHDFGGTAHGASKGG
jgi:hypothetical protein